MSKIAISSGCNSSLGLILHTPVFRRLGAMENRGGARSFRHDEEIYGEAFSALTN